MFQSRQDNQRLVDIAAWANQQGYKVRYKNKQPELYSWTKGRVSAMLKDPVYAGVLKYGKSLVMLRDHYDFIPAVSVGDFLTINKVNELTDTAIKSNITGANKDKVRANLLRGCVVCGHCGKKMSSGITPKKTKNGKTEYYYYRCETDYCDYKNRSVRAKVIVGYAIDFLKANLFTAKENYENYKLEAKEKLSESRREIKSAIGSTSKQIEEKKEEYLRAKNLLLKDDSLKEHFNLDEIQSEKVLLEEKLSKLQTELSDLKTTILTYNKYLELFENIGEIIEVGVANSINMEALDSILRKFFLNFTVSPSGDRQLQWSVTDYKLKEPWQGFINEQKVVRGRGDRT